MKKMWNQGIHEMALKKLDQKETWSLGSSTRC